MMPNTERPTREIDLPFTNGKAVVKEWITGREKEQIDSVIQGALGIKPNASGSIQFGEIPPDKIVASTHKAIEVIVQSVNGKTENVVDDILDLPVEDYNVVLTHIQELVKKK